MKHAAALVALLACTTLVTAQRNRLDVSPILSAPNITTPTGATSFIVPPAPNNTTPYTAKGLSDVAPFLALFDAANHYRQQFDAEEEGYFHQDLGALPPVAQGPGGTIKLWNIENPALYDQRASQALVEFEPCGLNLPHVHPRGLEFIHVLYGNITVTFIEENGGRAVSKQLAPGNSMFIPQGLVHAEHNLGCEPAAFMNTFTNTDPGVSSTHNALLQFPKDTIITALGNVEESVVDMLLAVQPTSLAQGPPSCMQTCNIVRNTSG